MSEVKINVGDRVVHEKFGEGVARLFHNDGDVGVVFDEYDSALHNLHGNCQDGHGWYCKKSDLVLLSAVKSPKVKSQAKPKHRTEAAKANLIAKIEKIQENIKGLPKTNPDIPNKKMVEGKEVTVLKRADIATLALRLQTVEDKYPSTTEEILDKEKNVIGTRAVEHPKVVKLRAQIRRMKGEQLIHDLNQELRAIELMEQLNISNLVLNDPAVVTLYKDDEKVVVKTGGDDIFNPEFAFLMTYFQKTSGFTKREVAILMDYIRKGQVLKIKK